MLHQMRGFSSVFINQKFLLILLTATGTSKSCFVVTESHTHTQNRLGVLAKVALAILCTFEVPTTKVSDDRLVGEAGLLKSRP